MLRFSAALLAALLFSRPAAADDDPVAPLLPKVGLPAFADDGALFVFRERGISVYGGQDTLTVLDVTTLEQERFVVNSAAGEGEPQEDIEAAEATATKGREAWAKWARQHTFKAATPSRTSPDGKRTAGLVLRDGTTSPKCTKAPAAFCYANPLPDDPCAVMFGCSAMAGRVIAQVTRAGTTTLLHEFAAPGLTGLISPYWLDAERVLWLQEDEGGNPQRDGQHCEALISRGEAVVELLGEEALTKKVGADVSAALARGGFTTLRIARAQKARAQSVVYAAKGAEADAAALAALVPGGATVEALSWKSEARLVLALGTSAAGAPQKSKSP
jgi:hypothetical protein